MGRTVTAYNVTEDLWMDAEILEVLPGDKFKLNFPDHGTEVDQ